MKIGGDNPDFWLTHKVYKFVGARRRDSIREIPMWRPPTELDDILRKECSLKLLEFKKWPKSYSLLLELR